MQVLDALELDEPTQAFVSCPPDEAGFEDGAAKRLEVGPHQLGLLTLGQLGQAQPHVDARDVTIAPAERMCEPAERTPDRHLRSERQQVDDSDETKRNPQ